MYIASRRSCILISPFCLSCVNCNRSAECSVADFAQKWVEQQGRAGTHAHRGKKNKKHRITISPLTFTSVGFFFLGIRGGASRTEARDLGDELESRARKRHTAEGEGADSQWDLLKAPCDKLSSHPSCDALKRGCAARGRLRPSQWIVSVTWWEINVTSAPQPTSGYDSYWDCLTWQEY